MDTKQMPLNWTLLKLVDAAEVKYGKARPKEAGNIPVIGSGGVYGNTSKALTDFPTIVIGRKGTAGFAWLQEQPCWPSDTTFFLNWKNEKLDYHYLYYHLQGNPLSGQHAKTTLPSILKQDLENYTLLVPPLPEQRAIARALRAVQGAREARLREIALERERKAALMEHLFTHGTRGEATKMTEIGEMPESWSVMKLGDICSINTGTTPSTEQPKYYIGTVPFIKTSEIANNKIKSSEVSINEDAIKDYNLKIYPPGTVFLAMYGQGKTRGQVSLLEISAATTQNTAAIVPSDKLAAEFLWQWLMNQYDMLREAGSQGHISHLNLGYVKHYRISLPPKNEQHIITKILSACDSKIAALDHEARLHDELFRAMLEELMSGRLAAGALAEMQKLEAKSDPGGQETLHCSYQHR